MGQGLGLGLDGVAPTHDNLQQIVAFPVGMERGSWGVGTAIDATYFWMGICIQLRQLRAGQIYFYMHAP